MRRALLALLLAPVVALAQTTTGTTTVDNLSTNQQGSNITNSSNSNNNSASTTYNGNAPGSMPPSSAISPSFMSSGNDTCLVGRGGSIQTHVFGLSAGGYERDLNCERIKLSRQLNDVGLKIAAVAVLCGDPRVFRAMQLAGTPCPAYGAIGKSATLFWQMNPELRPDYDPKANDQWPLTPPGGATATDGGGSLSDRFRASKRAGANAEPADGGNKPPERK
jgi:hypothetical protein